MKITGDKFIDSGNYVLKLLESSHGNRQRAVEFLIDLYIGEWNKAAFNFFPNSPFCRPVEPDRRAAACAIYLGTEDLKATRDKVMLSYSNAFVNFTPAFSGQKITIEDAQAQLAMPLATRLFSDGLFGLVMSNNQAVFEKYVEENFKKNMASEKPYFEQDWFETFGRRFLLKNGVKGDCLDWILFTNYNQNPDCKVGLFGWKDSKEWAKQQKVKLSAKPLAGRFAEIGATHKDFIAWANQLGVKVSAGEVLRHLGRYENEPPRKISSGFQIAYLLFISNFSRG